MSRGFYKVVNKMYFMSPKPPEDEEDKLVISWLSTVGDVVPLYISLVEINFSNFFDEKSICNISVSAVDV